MFYVKKQKPIVILSIFLTILGIFTNYNGNPLVRGRPFREIIKIIYVTE